MTGELPGDVAPTKPAADTGADESSNVAPESLPGQPGDQAAEVAALHPPASKTGTPTKKSNADSRKAELNAEILALKSERDRLRAERESLAPRPVPQADVTTGSQPPAVPDLAQTLSQPNIRQPMLSETSFWEQFPNATVGDYARYIARYELQADAAQRYDIAARLDRAQPFLDARAKKVAEDPQWSDRLDVRIKTMVPLDGLPAGTAPKVENVIAQAIMTSPQAIALMDHLSSTPAVLDRLMALTSAAAVEREIGRLESKLDAPSSVAPAAPAALPVSLAPPPPATLGTKPSQPADELSEAIRSGDFARYRELQNRKELAHT